MVGGCVGGSAPWPSGRKRGNRTTPLVKPEPSAAWEWRGDQYTQELDEIFHLFQFRVFCLQLCLCTMCSNKARRRNWIPLNCSDRHLWYVDAGKWIVVLQESSWYSQLTLKPCLHSTSTVWLSLTRILLRGREVTLRHFLTHGVALCAYLLTHLLCEGTQGLWQVGRVWKQIGPAEQPAA